MVEKLERVIDGTLKFLGIRIKSKEPEIIPFCAHINPRYKPDEASTLLGNTKGVQVYYNAGNVVYCGMSRDLYERVFDSPLQNTDEPKKYIEKRSPRVPCFLFPIVDKIEANRYHVKEDDCFRKSA